MYINYYYLRAVKWILRPDYTLLLINAKPQKITSIEEKQNGLASEKFNGKKNFLLEPILKF
jgi:hypothetical protein